MKKVHVVWLDNFVRFLPRRQPTLSHPIYENSMWTVHGIITIPPALQEMDLVASGDVMPPRLQAAELVGYVEAAFNNRLQESSLRFDKSISKGSQSLPVRIADYEALKQRNMLAPRVEFIPYTFHPQNICSNAGLREMLFDMEKSRDASPWSMLLLDSNIYKRVLKVLDT